MPEIGPFLIFLSLLGEGWFVKKKPSLIEALALQKHCGSIQTHSPCGKYAAMSLSMVGKCLRVTIRNGTRSLRSRFNASRQT